MNKEKPVRVAQIVGKWIGGGVESLLLNYYQNIDRTKIQFDFICDEDSTDIPYDKIKELGGRVILIPPYQHPFKYHRKLKKILKEENYKIVHSHISTMSVFSLFAAKCAGVPVRIAHSHSTTNKKEKKRNLLKQILRPFSKVFATEYMCCSELAGRWLFGDKEYNNGNVYLLNNAIDLEKFKYDENIRNLKRKELNISDDMLVIGHVGRFVEQKNHRFLIDIFSEVHKKNSNSILILAGQGPLMKEIKEKVEKLDINDCVRFLGQRNDIDELYQAFDVFCLPSLYEGLPVVGVEAQATGLLCILSNDMTKETKVLNTTEFLSLKQEPVEWADCIIETKKKFKRKNTRKEIANNNFDISVEANKLENKYNELLDKCNKYYSFDIFDTLIKRFINEKNFFEIVGLKLKKEKILIDDFAKRRKKYEIYLNSLNKNYTILDIYNNFTELSEKEKIKAINIEKNLIKSNMIPNKEGIDFFVKCDNKICISDMYLSGNFLQEILENNKLNGIKEVMVSCDYNGKSKRNKMLYNVALSKYNITKHYGDALRSDYINAILSGIKARRIKHSARRFLFDYNNGNYYFNIGVNVFGPMIYEFNFWLEEQISHYLNSNVLFLTREGYYLKKSFEMQCGKKGELLYISRKSLLIGSCKEFIQKYNFEEFINYFKIKRNISLRSFLKKIGCDNEKTMLKYNKKLNDIIDEFIYDELKKDEQIIALLKNNNANFEKYMNRFIKKKNILIDVGWNGTMQMYLKDYYKIKKSNIEFFGLYIGCMKGKNKNGFLFKESNKDYDKIMCFSGLLENIFMPSFGTTINYDNDGNPILKESEFSCNSKKCIKELQNGIDFFICKMKELDNVMHFCNKEIINNLYELGLTPNKNDIKKFSEIELLDGESINNLISGEKGNVIKKFISSKWKTAFLIQKTNLKIDYSCLISRLRNMRK